MDHALEPHRQLAQRRGRADRRAAERTERGSFMGLPFKMLVCRLEECKGRAKWAALGSADAARMIDVLNLALPYFGLIFLGFACGKLKQIPDTALAWMNFFIVYLSLPALFYRILAQTPLEQLAQRAISSLPPRWRRSGCSPLSFASAWRSGAATSPKSTIAGAGRRLRQYRLHGAGPRAGDARSAGGGAGRADLLLRHAAVVLAGAAADGAGAARSKRASARPSSKCVQDVSLPIRS